MTKRRSMFGGITHARYIEATVPVHLITRVFQGRCMLRPCPRLNRIVIGVLGRSRELYPSLQLYAVAFLSNHMHAQAMGAADVVAKWMGFVKREISTRWAKQCGIPWSDAMWSRGYHATALPTADSQVQCLQYILSQGVKEGLVAKAQLWPGVHAAKPLLSDTKLTGEWFDGTSYSRKRDAESRKKNPRPVREADYYRTVEVDFDAIPAWADLNDAARRARIRQMLEEIETEGRLARKGRRTLGARGVARVPLNHRVSLPPQPWFEHRRRMICWARRNAPETRAYLHRYWTFQHAFRHASNLRREGHFDIDYPPGAFRPVTFATSPPAA